MIGAACFHPDPLHLFWELPELLLPSSLSPPGTTTASNRSGRSSISLGSRTSDPQSWCLISNFSKPFSQYSIVTSSLFQLTNLFLTHTHTHTSQKYCVFYSSVLPLCLSFPLQPLTCRFFLMSLASSCSP